MADYDINSKYNIIEESIIKQSKICDKHKTHYIYYCVDCDENLCGLCISPYNYEENVLQNPHQNHNVYKIKQLEKKKNLINYISEYQIILKEINKYQKEINSYNEKISYLNSLKKIYGNEFNQIINYSKNNISFLRNKNENVKVTIHSNKMNFQNQIPPINIAIKNIIDRKQKNGYKDLLKYYSEKFKHLKNDNFNLSSFNGVLEQLPSNIKFESVQSEKIILEKIIHKDEDNLYKDKLILRNGKTIYYNIEKVKPHKIRFDVKIRKELTHFQILEDIKYNVVILLKENNKNEYKCIFLKEYSEKKDPNFYIFYELYSIYSFYISANNNGDIEIKIIISKIKN